MLLLSLRLTFPFGWRPDCRVNRGSERVLALPRQDRNLMPAVQGERRGECARPNAVWILLRQLPAELLQNRIRIRNERLVGIVEALELRTHEALQHRARNFTEQIISSDAETRRTSNGYRAAFAQCPSRSSRALRKRPFRRPPSPSPRE